MKKTQILFLITAMLSNPMTLALDNQSTHQEKIEQEVSDPDADFYDQLAWAFGLYLFVIFMQEDPSP